MSPDERRASIRGDEDTAALVAACEPGVALCTIVGIDGSFSRRLGAQLAVLPDGGVVGSLSDGCLEAQLASDCRTIEAPEVRRYGHGSGNVDFRLPCGGGLDILLDPSPDRAECGAVLSRLGERRPASLRLPENACLDRRAYLPSLVIRAIGEGPELAALASLGAAAGVTVDSIPKDTLSLGKASGRAQADPWTAVVLLFHDHEWEGALLEEALASEAFYIGAQGGQVARANRIGLLRDRGVSERDLARITSPIGSTRASRTPQGLALSVLAEVTSRFERLQDSA